MKRTDAEQGFTIVELMMALAILAFGITALIDLKLAIQEQQARQLSSAKVIKLESNALVLLRRVNPATERSGKRQLEGEATLTWQADVIGPVAAQIVWAGRTTAQRVAIFKVAYRITHKGEVVSNNSIEQIGRFGSPLPFGNPANPPR